MSKKTYIKITLPFHLSQKVLNYYTLDKYHLNGQPCKGKCTVMEIMKLTIKEKFHLGTCEQFSFSHHKITLS